MFGSFSVINIIVLLNLLIAMMNHSYQLISVSSVSDITCLKTAQGSNKKPKTKRPKTKSPKQKDPKPKDPKQKDPKPKDPKQKDPRQNVSRHKGQ